MKAGECGRYGNDEVGAIIPATLGLELQCDQRGSCREIPSDRVPSAQDPMEGFHQRGSTHQRGPIQGVPLEGVPHHTGQSPWSRSIIRGPISPPDQLWRDPNSPRHTDIAPSLQAAPSTQRDGVMGVPVPISPTAPSPLRCQCYPFWGQGASAFNLHHSPFSSTGTAGPPLAPISLHPPQSTGITHIHIPRDVGTVPWLYPSAAPHPTHLHVPLPLLSPCISLLLLALPAVPGSG